MFQQLPRGLPDQIARSIGIRIVGGKIKQGEKFDNEDQIAIEFGVSRTVVREAMKRLSAKGLVEVRPRVGTSVLNRNRWSLLDPDIMDWCLETTPTLEVLMQLREMRSVIEPGAVALACTRANEGDVEKIMAMYERMEAGVEQPETFALADTEFHVEILKASHNEYLSSLAGLIRTDLMSSIKVTNPDKEKNIRSLKFHKDVALAIAEHDIEKAEKAMHVLLGDAGRRLRIAFESNLS